MKREKQTERDMYRGDDYLLENELPFNGNTESEMTFYPASYSSNKMKNTASASETYSQTTLHLDHEPSGVDDGCNRF